MTDLERNFEKSQARVLQLEEEREEREEQLASLTTQVSALTADLAAAKDEIVMYTEDLQAANVRRDSVCGCCLFGVVG
jgi:chromosome segregation ATPase